MDRCSLDAEALNGRLLFAIPKKGTRHGHVAFTSDFYVGRLYDKCISLLAGQILVIPIFDKPSQSAHRRRYTVPETQQVRCLPSVESSHCSVSPLDLSCPTGSEFLSVYSCPLQTSHLLSAKAMSIWESQVMM
jgi:hypothetical protein